MGFYNTFGRHYTSHRGAGSYRSAAPKIMTARYAGTCADCGSAIAAGATMRYDGRTRCADPAACAAATARRAALAATLCSNGGEANRLAASAGSAFRGPQAPTFDLTPIRAFIQGAKDRGLKFPKLRVLDADGRTELTLGLTVSGHAPGSVSVQRTGEFVGTVRPDGQITRGITPALAEHLLAVAADPAAAAKRYAVLKCRCSFCGLELTDAGSVEVGYGPVCAKHWGLPHRPQGTPAPVAVAHDVEADERAMQAMEAEADRAQTARETHHTMTEAW